MPAEILLTNSGRALVCRFSGTVDDAEIESTTDSIRARNDIGPDTCLIVDMTDVQSFTVTPAGARWIVGSPGPFYRNHQPIIIIAPDDLIYGTARLLAASSEGVLKVHAVRSPEEAMQIAGVPSLA